MNNIEKEKNYIDNILQMQEYNSINTAKAGILSILKGYVQKGKITQEQYDELTMYLEQKIEQIKTKNETSKNFYPSKNLQNTNSLNNIKQQYQEKLKVEPQKLKYIPIYQGKFNSIPQKNEDTKER